MVNLQQAYARFNKSLFGGKLPEVPVQFGSLVGKAGVFQGNWIPQQKQIVDGSASITIENRYRNDDQQVLGILLHEMVHAYFYFARQFYVDHGQPFKTMLTKLAAQAGLPAPMTEDITDLNEVITPIKLGVILIQKQGGDDFVFALVDPRGLKEDDIRSAAKDLLSDYASTYEAFTVNTVVWTRIASFKPLQRGGLSRLCFFKDTDGVTGWVEDLRENGKMILSLGYHQEELDEALKLGMKQTGSGVQAFLDEFRSETTPNPMNPRDRVFQNVAVLSMSAAFYNPDTDVELDDIRSISKGGGTTAMKMICGLADKHHVPVKLYAKGYANVPTDKLIAYYERFGFVAEDEYDEESGDGVDMTRRPR